MVTLKKIYLENYKRFSKKEITTTHRSEISGKNGYGKSTFMDAYFDVLTGKIADGTLPNNVRKLVNGKAIEEPVIRKLTLDIDGEEVVIAKETKKTKTGETTVYYTNGHKRNKKDYEEYLSDKLGTENFGMCSNAGIFLKELSKSTANARKTLAELAQFDEKEFLINSEFASENILNKIDTHLTTEELIKDLKREKRNVAKEVSEKVAEIERLIEEKEALNQQRETESRNEILDKLNEIGKTESELNNLSATYDNLQYEIVGLKKSLNGLERDIKESSNEEKIKITNLINDRKVKLQQAESNLRTTSSLLNNTESVETLKATLEDIRKSYTETFNMTWDDSEREKIEKSEFDEKTAICPVCGQSLPLDKINELKADFEQRKQELIKGQLKAKELFEQTKKTNLELITKRGNDAKKRLEENTEVRSKLENEIKTINKEVHSLEKEISKYQNKLNEINTQNADIDLENNTEYKAVLDEIAKKTKQLEELDSNEDKRSEIANNKAELTNKLAMLDAERKIREKQVENINKRIATASDEQKELAQHVADKEKEINTVISFSIQKNKALADKVNKHFKHFKFVFLDYTADGEPQEVCKMVCNGIDYMNGLNTSDKKLTEIDLCVGLQDMNGLCLPIWLDESSVIDTDRLPTGIKQQLIVLKRSDNELKAGEIEVKVGEVE